jgi:tetratricopeptide (TPR) repeat protein
MAEQIRLELTTEERALLKVSRSVDPRSYDAYLRGLGLRGSPMLARVWAPRTIDHFEQAVELDTNFAEGWAALAYTRALLGFAGFNVRYRTEFPKAREAAQRALEIDDRLGGAHASLGNVRLAYDWDFPGARRAYERALQLSPSDPSGIDGYAWYLLLVEGKSEEALDLSERLLRIAPFDLYWRSQRVSHFYMARQYERALEEVERTRLLDRDFQHDQVSWSYAKLGQIDEAHRAEVALNEQCGSLCERRKEVLKRGWAEGGWEGSLRAWLEVAINIEGFSPWMIASQFSWIGATDEALTWLERGHRDRDPFMILTRADPSMDPLRSDPRYHDLLRRIGFPEE